MKISTKVECGIIALIDIAIHSENGEAVAVSSISKRQNISVKYLEQILVALRADTSDPGHQGIQRRLCRRTPGRSDLIPGDH